MAQGQGQMKYGPLVSRSRKGTMLSRARSFSPFSRKASRRRSRTSGQWRRAVLGPFKMVVLAIISIRRMKQGAAFALTRREKEALIKVHQDEVESLLTFKGIDSILCSIGWALNHKDLTSALDAVEWQDGKILSGHMFLRLCKIIKMRQAQARKKELEDAFAYLCEGDESDEIRGEVISEACSKIGVQVNLNSEQVFGFEDFIRHVIGVRALGTALKESEQDIALDELLFHGERDAAVLRGWRQRNASTALPYEQVEEDVLRRQTYLLTNREQYRVPSVHNVAKMGRALIIAERMATALAAENDEVHSWPCSNANTAPRTHSIYNSHSHSALSRVKTKLPLVTSFKHFTREESQARLDKVLSKCKSVKEAKIACITPAGQMPGYAASCGGKGVGLAVTKPELRKRTYPKSTRDWRNHIPDDELPLLLSPEQMVEFKAIKRRLCRRTLKLKSRWNSPPRIESTPIDTAALPPLLRGWLRSDSTRRAKLHVIPIESAFK